MKKFGLLLAAASMAVAVSAQTVDESKTFDNFYIGINGGLATKTTHNSWLNHLNPNAGLRIGRNFTPVFGLAAESNAYFQNKPYMSTGTFVRGINTSLLGTINFSNWFGRYPGEPRVFEVIGLYGFGWGHVFGNNKVYDNINHDNLTSKAAIDFAFNFGSNKQWQFYIEPSINYALNGDGLQDVRYDINRSFVQLNAGFIYKFKGSNDAHNFTIAKAVDMSQIDDLNAQINRLRKDLNGKDADLAAKDRKIAELKDALDECNKRPRYEKPATATNLQPTVLFKQGKYNIEPAQYAPIELIANYMKNNPSAKVEIRGYASPEGPADLNQRLSEKRAQAVKDALVKKYKISADRLTTKGMGVTDKLFEQVEFNRVATFNDDSKTK